MPKLANVACLAIISFGAGWPGSDRTIWATLNAARKSLALHFRCQVPLGYCNQINHGAHQSAREYIGLIVCGALLTLIVISPSFLVDVPAMIDYPNHLARMYILVSADTLEANPFYQVKWELQTNLAMDLLVPQLARFVNVETATKMFLVFSQLLVITGAMAILGICALCNSLWVRLLGNRPRSTMPIFPKIGWRIASQSGGGLASDYPIRRFVLNLADELITKSLCARLV